MTQIWTPIEIETDRSGRLSAPLGIGDDELQAEASPYLPTAGYHAYVLVGTTEIVKIAGGASSPYEILERGLFGTTESAHLIASDLNVLVFPLTVREIAQEEIAAADLPNWRGAFVPYNEAEPYMAGDVVEYEGSSYICVLDDTLGNPVDYLGTRWELFAARGEDGDQGDQGDPGPIGPGFTWRGTWVEPTGVGDAYFQNELVEFEGAAYVCVGEGVEEFGGAVFSGPGTEPDEWDLVAAKGDTGAAGPDNVLDGYDVDLSGATDGDFVRLDSGVVVPITPADLGEAIGLDEKADKTGTTEPVFEVANDGATSARGAVGGPENGLPGAIRIKRWNGSAWVDGSIAATEIVGTDMVLFDGGEEFLQIGDGDLGATITVDLDDNSTLNLWKIGDEGDTDFRGTIRVREPSDDADAASKAYVDAGLDEKLDLAGGSLSGELVAEGGIDLAGGYLYDSTGTLGIDADTVSAQQVSTRLLNGARQIVRDMEFVVDSKTITLYQSHNDSQTTVTMNVLGSGSNILSAFANLFFPKVFVIRKGQADEEYIVCPEPPVNVASNRWQFSNVMRGYPLAGGTGQSHSSGAAIKETDNWNYMHGWCIPFFDKDGGLCPIAYHGQADTNDASSPIKIFLPPRIAIGSWQPPSTVTGENYSGFFVMRESSDPHHVEIWEPYDNKKVIDFPSGTQAKYAEILHHAQTGTYIFHSIVGGDVA